MRNRIILLNFTLTLFALLMATPLFAVWPKPPYSQWPCSGPGCGDADNCYSFRSFSVDDALQFKSSDKSPRSTTEPTQPYGICSGYNAWCKLPPQLGSVTATVIPGDGTNGPRVQLSVPYDFPNNYCQVYDDGAPCRASVWPPKQTLFSPVTRLTVYSGTEPLAIAPAVFETGTWTPTLDIGCGGTMTFIVEAKNGGEFVPGCATGDPSDHTVRQEITVTVPAGACFPDRRCADPVCAAGGGNGMSPPRGGGKPIHFGSGDVNVNVPLFSIAQPQLPVAMSLAYHSSPAMFSQTTLPQVVLPEPLGSGWTHTFNDFLVALDPGAFLLYRVDGNGYETLYERSGLNQWTPRSPGELRGRETVTLAGGQYRITTLDGTVTAFSGGRWVSTTDRWGNSIAGSYNGANLATVTDSAGRVVTFDYSGSRLASIALPGGETWRFGGAPLSAIYDPMHTGATPWRTISYVADRNGAQRLLHELSDESGAVLEGHEYDAQDRGRASYAEGNRDRMTVAYGANSARVVTVIDGSLVQTSDFTFAYRNGRYLTTKIVGPCASCGGASSDTQSFTYDANGRVTSATDGDGHVTRFTYDASGNILTRTEAAGTALERTVAFAYEHAGWRDFPTRASEPSAAKPGAQKVTTRTWSAGETVLTVTETGYLPDGATETHTSTATFDARHRLVSVDGPRAGAIDVGATAYYPDDDADPARRGRVRQETGPTGLTTAYDDYNTYGQARQVTDANGVRMTLATDARGRLTESTVHPVAGDPAESLAYVDTTEWDGRDRIIRETRPRGNGIVSEYEDGTNRRLATIRVDGQGRQRERQLVTRNSIGGVTREEDKVCTAPAAQCASWVTRASRGFAYDSNNRMRELLHATPAGAKTVFGYDADGHRVSVQEENHAAPNIRYAYDAHGRLVSTTEVLAGAPGGVVVTRGSYDVHNNLVSATDRNGNVVRYAYDDFRRLTRQESPVTGVTTFSYDAAGNVLTITDARGATTTRTYDGAGRVLATVSTLGGSTESVTNTWDDAATGPYAKGQLSSVTDPSGSVSYTYDRRGRKLSEVKTILGDSYTMNFEYDANGNRRTIVYPTGGRAVYEFDFADRPLSLRGEFGGASRDYVTSADYQPFGPEASRVYAGGLSRIATHDTRYRLTGFDIRNGASALAGYRYAYDAAGNLTSISDVVDPRYNRSFAYDDLDRLTSAGAGAALWGSATWEYDPLGNQLASTLGTRTSTFQYVTAGGAITSRLQSVTESGRGTRPVTYDDAGNELEVGGVSFTYSPRNRLAEGQGLRYLYDGAGLRVAQIGISVGPIITVQPLSQPVCPGGSVTLTVTASGATGFQWQSFAGSGWQDVAGQTTRTLTVTPSAATQYRAVVSNAAASTTSDIALITPTALATEPASGILYGDVNSDGSVNAADVAALRSALAGSASLPVPAAVADLDGDGNLNAVDLSLLGGFAGGAVSCLPRFNTFTAGAPLAAGTMTSASRVATNQAASNPTQYFFYSPEMTLLAETEIRAGGGKPRVAIEYLWFNGRPVAEERALTQETRLTFTDHLGTPFLQTGSAGAVVWRVEYDPFGSVYAVRAGTAADQRLRFPGQENDDQTPEHAYNVFRWYRSGWGRYTQPDPLGARQTDDPNLYAYAGNDPAGSIDPLGLASREGFEGVDDEMMRRAIQRLKDFLATNPQCCKDLGGTWLTDIQRDFERAHFVYGGMMMFGNCGYVWTGSTTVHIGPNAFEPGSDCPCLPVVLLHEVSHISGAMDIPGQKHRWFGKSAHQIGNDCAAGTDLCKNWFSEVEHLRELRRNRRKGGPRLWGDDDDGRQE